jgi:hypothetical protein
VDAARPVQSIEAIATASDTAQPTSVEKQTAPSSTSRASRPAAPSRAAEPASTAERTISIREEIDLLDRARTALARGKYELTLTLLDRYSARYPQGELREEANAVRVDALRKRQVRSPR